MRMTEIPPKSTITIRAVKKEISYELTATVAGVKNDKLYLKLIRHKGQVINFESKNVTLLAFYVKDGIEPLGWSGLTIKREKLGNSEYHAVTCHKKSVHINRRGARRVFIEHPCTITLKSMDAALEGIITDVSFTGIGFSTDKDINESDFLPVIIRFEDELVGNISVTTAIMRRVNVGEGRFGFGANIPKPSESWMLFVNRIYREYPEEPAEPPV